MMKTGHAPLKWYVLYTRTRYEKKVTDQLRELGFDIYLPLQKTLRQWSDRKKKVEVPLFNGYIFIHTSRRKLTIVPRVPGMLSVVSFNGEPAEVPEEIIQSLKILLESEQNFVVTHEQFTAGDQVEVIRGSMKGIKGMFIDYRGKKNVLLRIDALQRSLIITINPLHIRRLENAGC